MNISELKEMARKSKEGVLYSYAAFANAILSLPDDDCEELVRLAERVILFEHLNSIPSNNLARAVLSRYRKREEPRKVSGWVAVFEDGALGLVSRTEAEALRDSRMKAWGDNNSGGISRLMPVAAIFVSGIEGVSPDQSEEAK